MTSIYDHLKKGNMCYMMEECKYKRIHYIPDNIINILVVANNSIFMEILDFFINYINDYIVHNTFERLLIIEDNIDKLEIINLFLNKYNLEYMLYRNIEGLFEFAIKYNRLNSIKKIIYLMRSYNKLYKLHSCYNYISNINLFKYIAKEYNDIITKDINMIFNIMINQYNKEILIYIISNYKLIDYTNNINNNYCYNIGYYNKKIEKYNI
jgi:hypothetical protein